MQLMCSGYMHTESKETVTRNSEPATTLCVARQLKDIDENSMHSDMLRELILCIQRVQAHNLHCTYRLLSVHNSHLQSLAARQAGPTIPTSASYSTQDSATATTTPSSSSEHITAPAQDGKHRRGFGGKVVLPAEDVLKQTIVSSTDNPLTFRAYHVGSRIHIGQVLARVSSLHPTCRTTAGKDYAIFWVADVLQAAPHSLHSTRSLSPWHLSLQRILLAPAAAVIQPLRDYLAPAKAETPGSHNGKLGQQPEVQVDSETAHHAEGPTQPVPHAPSITEQHDLTQQNNNRQQQQQPHASLASGAEESLLWKTEPASLVPAQLKVGDGPQSDQQSQSLQLPFMTVYRSGSVVFCGMGEKEEVLWLGHMVPPAVRYTSEERSPWTRTGLHVSAVAAKEMHQVLVHPLCSGRALQTNDQLLLQVLDVGTARVLTSVLAQSAALRFYEESVQRSLESLADWRAANSSTRTSRNTWGFSSVLSGQQDKVLFKVIAASALIINDAQQLLEMDKPAWQYNAYNKIWELMAKDYELESRFNALEMKLRQVETEAKHDVKARAGRRSRKLEQSLVWLLVVSCAVASVEAVKKLMLLWSKYDQGDGSTALVDGGVVTQPVRTAVKQGASDVTGDVQLD